MKELFDLSGQVAIVTGGGYGLGYQLAMPWGSRSESGDCRQKLDKCKASAEILERELGVRVLPARLDLTQPAEIDALFERVQKEFGKVDILVNNSGVALVEPIFKFSLETWRQVIDTNLTGLWLMCQKAGSLMTRQGYGRIINIASITGLIGCPSDVVMSPPYNASKAAVMGLTRDLAVKWAKKKVTVNALVPGWFESDMGEQNKPAHDKLNEYYIPMGRFGTDDELKAALLFLASPGASYVTGAGIVVDGGITIQ
jgi:gluconate 5-dehydrogenase